MGSPVRHISTRARRGIRCCSTLSTWAGNNTQLDLGQAKHRVPTRHRHIAHRQQAHAARHARTVDPRNQRNVAGARRAQHPRQVALGFGVVGGERVGGLQIGTRAKRFRARAGDDDGADALLLRRMDGVCRGGQQAVAALALRRSSRVIVSHRQLPCCASDNWGWNWVGAWPWRWVVVGLNNKPYLLAAPWHAVAWSASHSAACVCAHPCHRSRDCPCSQTPPHPSRLTPPAPWPSCLCFHCPPCCFLGHAGPANF